MITEVEPYIFISSKIDQKHIDEMIYLIKECDGAEYYLKDVNKIYKTDWNMPKNMNRPYWQYFAEHCLDDFAADFLDQFKADKLEIINYWFQMYKKGDYHNWHTHPMANFSHVLFLQANGTTEIQRSKYKNQDPEGAILTFPAFLKHKSPPAKDEKIVMAFNTNLQIL